MHRKRAEVEECREPAQDPFERLWGMWDDTDQPTWNRTEELRKDDGPIFARLYEEKVLRVPTPEPPPQPARPDLRALVCRACGMPASPHRYAHAVEIIIPARVAKLP